MPAETTRSAIEAAAARLVASLPADRVTMSAVAREAGVSVQTVRRHCGGKAGLRALLSRVGGSGGGAGPDSSPGTRDRILGAARAVFAREGYAAATLDKVGLEAGLTKGAVYWHFESKTALFLALLDQGHQANLNELPSSPASLTSVLSPWLAGQFRAYRDRRDEAAVFWEFFAQRRDPAVAATLRESWASFLAGVTEKVKRLQADGLIRADLDPGLIAEVADAVLNGLAVRWLVDPDWADPSGPEGVAGAITDLLMRGLAATPGTEAGRS